MSHSSSNLALASVVASLADANKLNEPNNFEVLSRLDEGVNLRSAAEKEQVLAFIGQCEPQVEVGHEWHCALCDGVEDLLLVRHQCRRTYRLVTHVGCGLGRRSRFGPVGAPAPQQQAEADGVVRACWAHGRALQLHSMLSVGVSLWMLDVVTCCANSWIRRCSITRCCSPFEWERWSRVLPYVGGRCASGAQSAMSVGSAEAFLACLVGAPVGGGSRGGWGPQTGPNSWPQSDGEKSTLP